MLDLGVSRDSEASVEAWAYLEVRGIIVIMELVTMQMVATRKTAFPKVNYEND